MVRKKLTAREGRGWLSGTLFCTHFRVAFVPQDSPKPDVSTAHAYFLIVSLLHVMLKDESVKYTQYNLRNIKTVHQSSRCS